MSENGLTIIEKSKLQKGATSAVDFVGSFQHMALVLDESGSMASPIEYSLTAPAAKPKADLQREVIVQYIREKVAKTDQLVTIVGFSTAGRVIIKGERDTQRLIAAVSDVASNGGSTNMSHGLVHAMNAVRQSLDYIPHIVVTSDGQVHDAQACEEVARQAAREGVVIDTIYIGVDDGSGAMEWMRKLAEMTGGVFECINSSATFKAKYLKVLERPLLTA